MSKIFVFGSNLAGRHGAGSALFAKRFYGAVYGQAEGRQGNSYGIPTKDAVLQTLPLNVIRRYVDTFLAYAAEHETTSRFHVVAIGCGLAGYKDADIAPMFAGAPCNCELPKGWR